MTVNIVILIRLHITLITIIINTSGNVVNSRFLHSPPTSRPKYEATKDEFSSPDNLSDRSFIYLIFCSTPANIFTKKGKKTLAHTPSKNGSVRFDSYQPLRTFLASTSSLITIHCDVRILFFTRRRRVVCSSVYTLNELTPLLAVW